MASVTARIDSLIKWLLVLTFPTVPLFFLPITQDFYDTNKWMLLLIISLIVTVLWAIRTVTSHAITVSVSPLALGFGALALASLVSVAASSPNKIEGLLAPYGLTLFAGMGALVLFGADTIDAKGKQILRFTWYACTVILSLIAIYQFFGVGKTMFPNIPYLGNELWTPVGSTLSLLTVLILTVPQAAGDLLSAVKKKDDAAMAVLFSLMLVTIAGIIVTLVKLLPLAGQTILSPKDGWAVTLEVLKDPKRALFGVGAENFLYAFTTGRPIALNTSSVWNLRFTTNASTLLHITATLGIFGLLGSLMFLKSLLPKYSLSMQSLTQVLAIGSFFLVPPTITLLVSYIVLLLLYTPEHTKTIHIPFPAKARWASGVIAFALVLGVGLSGYVLGRVYASELVFFQSLEALVKNDGTATYNLQIQAATLAPAISRYHLAYSQTNFAIANAIATQGQTANNTQPVQLSEADRQTISNLISQAIREAKIAVNLAPENAIAWENLARLYQNLINIAEGADQWSVATYQRAIQLDGTNPALRIGLGGIFLLRNDLDSAYQQFIFAVNLKPDWPNGHYNLAYVYRLKKENLKSAAELQQTLATLPGDSTDRPRVESELAQTKQLLTPAEMALLEGRQPTPDEVQAGSELSRPGEQPIPVITPKLELPPDASPPAAAVEAQTAAEDQAQGVQIERGPEEAKPSLQPQQ